MHVSDTYCPYPLNIVYRLFAMAFSHFSSCIFTILVFFILQFLFYSSHASLSSDAICKNTPFPNLCKSLLPTNDSIDIYDSGRLFIQLSLSATTQYLNSISDFLESPVGLLLPKSTFFALQDCQFLLGLNADLLSTADAVAKKPIHSLENTEGDDVASWLSATITNQQTCLDGLSVVPSNLQLANLVTPLISKGSMMCSLSLALFKSGWNPDAILGKISWSILKIREKVVVNPDGTGNFTSITDAIAAAPDNTQAEEGYYQINVVAGVYYEYVSIPSNKKYLMMVGSGIDKTIITGNRNVVDGWTTFNSATFAVSGEGFVAVNITFQNTAGAAKHQAVAVRNSADLSAFFYCSFEGYQDTLYTHSLRQFYKECNIYGTVDFIFGNAAVVLQNCNIYPRLPMHGQFNAITAQGRTDKNQNTGISFHKCTITPASDLASYNANATTKVRTYLGRPWKEYSRTVYMQSYMDSFINPDGWSIWTGDFALTTLYYAEYNNKGPGSNTSNRVTWPGYRGEINFMNAEHFTVSSFVVGDYWLPCTGVPYTGGLYL